MADEALFGPEPYAITVGIPGVMGRGWSADQPVMLLVGTCKRCGALVSDPKQHTAWHGSVDTNTTTRLAKGEPE